MAERAWGAYDRVRRETAARARRRKRERIEKLDKWLGLWRAARDIRSMLADIEADIMKKGFGPTSESLEHLEWVRRYADRNDPTKVPVSDKKACQEP